MKFEIIRRGNGGRSLSMCMKQVSLILNKYNKYNRRSCSVIPYSKVILDALVESKKKSKRNEKFNLNPQSISLASLYK
jgi:hypothetical protein